MFATVVWLPLEVIPKGMAEINHMLPKHLHNKAQTACIVLEKHFMWWHSCYNKKFCCLNISNVMHFHSYAYRRKWLTSTMCLQLFEAKLLQKMSTYINNKYVRIVWSFWNLIGVSAEYCLGACQISKRSDNYNINLTVSKVGENRCWKVERAIQWWLVDSLHKGSVIMKTCTFHEIMCRLWSHDDVIKWKQFPRYWPFVRIHRSPVNSRTKASDAELWCFLWYAPE